MITDSHFNVYFEDPITDKISRIQSIHSFILTLIFFD